MYFWTSVLQRSSVACVTSASCQLTHEGDWHLFFLKCHRPLFSVFTLTVRPAVSSNIDGLLLTPAETKKNKTVMSCVNHLLSLADQPLLGEHVTNCVSTLVTFSGKVTTSTQCSSLVLQQMRGITINSDITHIFST